MSTFGGGDNFGPKSPAATVVFENEPVRADVDLDGIDDDLDNCPIHANADQTETPCFDTDDDGHFDIDDNCPLIANNSQIDLDENGIGDACEVVVELVADPVAE